VEIINHKSEFRNPKSEIQNLKSAIRSLRLATWLGWQIESNWTDPFLFAVYSIVKPVASALILVVMYSIITQNDFGSPLFPYIYLGKAS
jgi:ABC-2 type transport system permease protein